MRLLDATAGHTHHTSAASVGWTKLQQQWLRIRDGVGHERWGIRKRCMATVGRSCGTIQVGLHRRNERKMVADNQGSYISLGWTVSCQHRAFSGVGALVVSFVPAECPVWGGGGVCGAYSESP